MAVLNKILTLLRSSVREIGDSVVDANANRIYEQEIVDAKSAVAQAREELTLVMAKEMQSAREIERLKVSAAQYEKHTLEALEKNETALAEEAAARVASLEDELDAQTKAHASYALNTAKLKDLIRKAESKLRDHERELAMARTTESVYRATQSISHNIGSSGSKLLSARESLERIKKRHEELQDRMSAAEILDRETAADALDHKLAKAGIGVVPDRAQAVLARVRASADAKATSRPA